MSKKLILIFDTIIKHKEKVRDIVQLTPNGDVIIKEKNLTAKQKILAYLIGKVYSKTAEYSKTDSATNKEIGEALALPDGTVKYTLFDLRKESLVESIDMGVHRIRLQNIGVAFEKYLEAGNKG
jgi:hypothetical protein